MNKNRYLRGGGYAIFRGLPSIMRILMILCGVSLTILIFSEVWLRYIFHLPLLWVEELAIIPAFWLYMLGAAYGAYDRSHIKVDLLPVFIKNERAKLIVMFIAALIALGFAVLFIFWGYDYFIYDLQMKPLTRTLMLPLVYAHSSIFFAGGIVAGFYFLIEAVDRGRKLFSSSTSIFEKGEA